jgi:hypothetical protein
MVDKYGADIPHLSHKEGALHAVPVNDYPFNNIAILGLKPAGW